MAVTEYHEMQSFLTGDAYLWLKWPKYLNLESLILAKEIVNLQLDTFIRIEMRKEEVSWAALEYASWFAQSQERKP
jgi:hypothetical protein